MKKKISALAMAAALTLTAGCSSVPSAYEKDGTIVLKDADITVTVPENWEISVGDDAYEALYGRYGGYSDANEFKSAMEEEKQYYLACAVKGDSAALTITALDMTAGYEDSEVDENAEVFSPADYARSVHDGAIFGCLSEGYSTGGDSVFSEETLGGKSGWLSYYELFAPDENGDKTFVMGQQDFMFMEGDYMYSVQTSYSDIKLRADAGQVLLSENT